MAAFKRKQSKRSNALVSIEAIIIAYVSYLTCFILTTLEVISVQQNAAVSVNVAVITLMSLVCMLAVGLYERKLRETFRGIIRRLFVSFAMAYVGAELIITLFFQELAIHPYYLPTAVGLNIISLVFFRYFVNRLGLMGLGSARILVVGAGVRASIIETRMRRDADRIGINLVGFVPVTGDDREQGIENENIIDVPIDNNFRNYLQEQGVDEIIIACDQRRGTIPIEVLFDCRLRGIEVTDLLDFMERETGQIVVDLMYPSWVIYSAGFHSQNYLRESLDYGLNAFLALFVLFFTWPIMLVTAIIIYFDDGRRTGSSVFYKQTRVGKDERLFSILKFRSMRPDAEKDGAKWASLNDNRVTSIGNFIRKYRIDELPQLFNVLKGEMSFIGPRPERPEFVEQLVEQVPYFNQRHNVKPGLAGWAQLNYPYGASVKDSLEKLKFDLYYVKHQSLLLDILILIRTVEVILFGKGR